MSGAAHDDIRLRVARVHHLRDRRLLLFFVTNRTALEIEVLRVRLYASHPGGRELEPVGYQLSTDVLSRDEEALGALLVPVTPSPNTTTKVRLKVELSEPLHNVELDDVQLS